MHGGRSLDEVHSELAEEHREIMTLVSRIRRERQVDALPRLLEELHAALANHFAHEQFPGGLYERMGATDPAHHDDIRVLVRDHCNILSGARALLERSQVASLRASPRMLEDVARLLRDLDDHEQREHRLAKKLNAQPVSAQ